MPSLRHTLLLAILAIGNAPLGLGAAPITLHGSHFSVTYDDSLLGLFGSPNLLGGDTLAFTPTNFKASSTGALVTQSASLPLTIVANTGYALTGLSLYETGDYFRIGGAVVNMNASLTATNLLTSLSTSVGLTPTTPLTATTSLSSFQTTNWEAIGSLSLVGIGSPVEASVELSNTLSASATSGMGFIEKKFAGLRIVTRPVPVPEPGSLVLLLAGLLAGLCIQARKNNSVRYSYLTATLKRFKEAIIWRSRLA